MDERLLSATRAASSVIGVDFGSYREGLIRRRLEYRMRLRGCSDVDSYCAVLAREPAERWRLANAFLIKTTTAFRDRPTWATMRETVLPRLVARCVRRDSSVMSTWVAGCATGEEAYSYAMAMLEARDRAGVRIEVRVFATDVDVSALEHAARGVYPASAFANTPPELAERYLLDTRDGRVAVVDALRDTVSLARDSLTACEPSPVSSQVFASFDVVSCCNVLLYFNDATRTAAFSRLLSSCERGGVVVLGEAEYPPSEYHRMLSRVADGTHAFEVIRGSEVTSSSQR